MAKKATNASKSDTTTFQNALPMAVARHQQADRFSGALLVLVLARKLAGKTNRGFVDQLEMAVLDVLQDAAQLEEAEEKVGQVTKSIIARVLAREKKRAVTRKR